MTTLNNNRQALSKMSVKFNYYVEFIKDNKINIFTCNPYINTNLLSFGDISNYMLLNSPKATFIDNNEFNLNL